MRNSDISYQEVQEWINFLYLDLLDDNINVGGYFFNLNDLDLIAQLKNKVDDISKNQKSEISNVPMSVVERLRNLPDFKKRKKYTYKPIKVMALNKFNKKVNLLLSPEELFFVYDKLQKAKIERQNFKSFLEEELHNEQVNEDIREFMCFINDFVDDIRKKSRKENSQYNS